MPGHQFPKASRLKRRQDIEHVFERGRRFSCRGMRIHVVTNDTTLSRLVIAPVRSYPSAVTRNRAKRVIRECWRQSKPTIAGGHDVAVVLFPGFDSFSQRNQQLERLLRQAGILT